MVILEPLGCQKFSKKTVFRQRGLVWTAHFVCVSVPPPSLILTRHGGYHKKNLLQTHNKYGACRNLKSDPLSELFWFANLVHKPGSEASSENSGLGTQTQTKLTWFVLIPNNKYENIFSSQNPVFCVRMKFSSRSKQAETQEHSLFEVISLADF